MFSLQFGFVQHLAIGLEHFRQIEIGTDPKVTSDFKCLTYLDFWSLCLITFWKTWNIDTMDLSVKFCSWIKELRCWVSTNSLDSESRNIIYKTIEHVERRIVLLHPPTGSWNGTVILERRYCDGNSPRNACPIFHDIEPTVEIHESVTSNKRPIIGHLLPQISMFCALYQSYQHLFEK